MGSLPAKAGNPVRPARRVTHGLAHLMSVVTGCPACAGHDGGEVGRTPPQLALSFFCTWRLMSSARRDRSSALALIRKASRPPRRSTGFNALVEIRSLTERPSTSDVAVALTSLQGKRRLVLMF